MEEGLSCGFSAKPTFYDSFDGFCSQMLHMPLSQHCWGRGVFAFQRVFASRWNSISSSSGYLNLASMPCVSRLAAISLLRALTMA